MAKSKKLFIIISVLSLIIVSVAQEISQDVSVINIEIQVRVFKGNKFVDNLTINDFEVFEEGIPQKIEAVYLIEKTKVKKEEGSSNITPEISRKFVFIFEITEYIPELEDVLDHFLDEVFVKGDSLLIISPMKLYDFNTSELLILSRHNWNSPEKMDTLKSLSGILIILQRAFLIQGGMSSLSIVKDFNILKDGPTGLILAVESH